jgi:hypothetical protein
MLFGQMMHMERIQMQGKTTQDMRIGFFRRRRFVLAKGEGGQTKWKPTRRTESSILEQTVPCWHEEHSTHEGWMLQRSCCCNEIAKKMVVNWSVSRYKEKQREMRRLDL